MAPNEIYVQIRKQETGAVMESSLNLSMEICKRVERRCIVIQENGQIGVFEEMVGEPIRKSFRVDSRLFLHPSNSLPFVANMLAQVNIDAHSQGRAIQQISSFGNKMANEVSQGRKVMSMHVDIWVVEVHLLNERAETARAMQESMEEGSGSGVIPASKSSIDQLHSVRFESGGSDSIKDCTICLEELTLGSLVTELPCNHLFHGECITRWLETSHLCPLCRFQMPV